MTKQQFQEFKPGFWVRLKWPGHHYTGFVVATDETPMGQKKGQTLRQVLVGTYPRTVRADSAVFDATGVRLSICVPSRRAYLEDRYREAAANVARSRTGETKPISSI